MFEQSFNIGKEFEKYVENNIFTHDKYTLVHRTNSFNDNKERYSEDTQKPDFKFRCKETGQEFYVEAKFRSGFDRNDKLEIISFSQFRRFQNYQKEEKCPVYLIIGYQGQPNDPLNISLILLDDLEYDGVYYSYISKYNIEKECYPNDLLVFPESKSIHKTTFNEVKNKKPLNYWKLLIPFMLIIGLVAFSFYGSSKNETPVSKINKLTDNEFKTIIAEYYQVLDNDELFKLDNYINPIVYKWYQKEQVTLIEIKEQQQLYQLKYPERISKVLWESFKVEPLESGYLVTYQLDYRIKSKTSQSFKAYNLLITSVWDEDFKLKSMMEKRL